MQICTFSVVQPRNGIKSIYLKHFVIIYFKICFRHGVAALSVFRAPIKKWLKKKERQEEEEDQE